MTKKGKSQKRFGLQTPEGRIPKTSEMKM